MFSETYRTGARFSMNLVCLLFPTSVLRTPISIDQTHVYTFAMAFVESTNLENQKSHKR